MKFKKIIALTLALASAAVFMPRLGTFSEVNAAKVYDESVCYIAEDGVYAVMSANGKGSVPVNSTVVQSGDFSYTVENDGSVYITDYSNSIVNLVVPSEIDGKTVTGIDIHDSSNKSHETITIPETVTRIFVGSMGRNSNLEEIIVDEKNTVYASENGILFNKDFTRLVRYPSGKSSKEPEYTLPDSVKTLEEAFGFTNMTAINAGSGNASFSSVDGVLFNKDKTEMIVYPRCKAGAEYILPETVTRIMPYAFVECEELASVKLNEGLKTIENIAFIGCNKITAINIPASVTLIVSGAFSYMSLENITVDENNSNYFTSEGVLFDKDMSNLILYPSGKTDVEYTIPDKVKNVGATAFSKGKFSRINFGKNVTNIDNDAFESCVNIESVVLPESLKCLSSQAFAFCRMLRSVTVPAGIEVMANVTADTTNNYGVMDYDGSWVNIFYGCPDDLVIHGTPGTVAEKYAIFWGIQFNENPVLSDTENDTGVTVMAPEGAVPENTVLNVEAKTSEEYPDSTVYDITLTSGGNPVQPSAAVSVKIPVPSGQNGSVFMVYYRDENGKLTDMKAVVSGGYIVFTTDHFSEYILTTQKLIPDVILGDLNGDTKVTIADARLLLQAASGSRTLTAEQEALADVNNDGKVNITDARWLLQVASGSRKL